MCLLTFPDERFVRRIVQRRCGTQVYISSASRKLTKPSGLPGATPPSAVFRQGREPLIGASRSRAANLQTVERWLLTHPCLSSSSLHTSTSHQWRDARYRHKDASSHNPQYPPFDRSNLSLLRPQRRIEVAEINFQIGDIVAFQSIQQRSLCRRASRLQKLDASYLPVATSESVISRFWNLVSMAF